MNAQVEEWVSYAHEDLEVAQHASRAGWLKSACFHAQQCGEKWLKALLIYYGQSPTRSHDLDYLADLLEPFVDNIGVIREAVLVLTEYAVAARYPNRLSIDDNEANQAVQYAKEVQVWAEALLYNASGQSP